MDQSLNEGIVSMLNFPNWITELWLYNWNVLVLCKHFLKHIGVIDSDGRNCHSNDSEETYIYIHIYVYKTITMHIKYIHEEHKKYPI